MSIKAFLFSLAPFLKQSLIVGFAAGLIALVVSLILPPSYNATSTFYVKRGITYTSATYFTYDGYYASQTAERYTDTVVGFLRSVDVRAQALTSIKQPVSSQTLGKLEDSVVVKKVGPQLVTMTVSGRDPQVVKDLWNALSKATLNRSSDLNRSGDSRLSIDVVGENPIVLESKLNPFITGIVGFLVFFAGTLTFLSFKKYLRGY